MVNETLNLESVNEDTVLCLFFSSASNADDVYWEQLRENVNKSIKSLSKDYIWHREKFRTHLPIDNKKRKDIPPHLVSTTCFGDNIEDEWFIVYIILAISKQYKDLVIQVKDNDGDFLLIEAADFLPSWANPDNTENRVYIYNNCIHLIPANLVDVNTELCLQDAIHLVIDPTKQTEAPEIQGAILKRLGNYPQKINDNIHRAIVKLPVDIATLLTMKPSLISPIVTAYCNHDTIDAKSCRGIKFENCVTVEVKFTKCLYAMLIHSKLIKINKYAYLNSSDKKTILGLKLTCGYQMIMSKLSEDVFSSKQYNKFIKSLEGSGYFKNNIEGSQNYKKLLENAKDFFLSIECPINAYVCNGIAQLMNTNEFIELRDSLKNKSDSLLDLVDDNEDWLNIQPEQLNDLLCSRYGKQSKFKSEDIISAQTISSELTNFLKQTSDFEGIEPKETIESNNIEFDSEEFVNSLKNMLDIVSSENCDVDIDSDISSDTEYVIKQEELDDLDIELKSKLHKDSNDTASSSKTILLNMMQSIKEEAGSTGPSSNILRTIGINKTDLLDSDDDDS